MLVMKEAHTHTGRLKQLLPPSTLVFSCSLCYTAMLRCTQEEGKKGGNDGDWDVKGEGEGEGQSMRHYDGDGGG